MHWRTSLLLRTLLAVTGVTLVLTAITATVVFNNAQEEALNEQDAYLSDMTSAFARADVAAVLPRALTMSPDQFAARLESDEPLLMRPRPHRHMMRHRRLTPPPEPLRRTAIPAGEPVLVRLLNNQGRAERVRFDHTLSSGLTTEMIGGEAYRLSLIFLPNGRYTAVADPVSTREAFAKSAAFTAIMPIVILLPMVWLVIALTLWRTLKPIRQTAETVKSRPASDLTPLPTDHVPAEVEPFVASVNQLLARVNEARTRELRFTADAAHELRSPLTSLTIEAEHLSRLNLPTEAKPIVERLESGLDRAVKQVSQLLHFARAQAGEAPESLARDTQSWYLSELLGEILEPLMTQADKKALDFSVEGLDDTEEIAIEGVSRAAVQAILRNLLENAFHYTPEHGDVCLNVHQTKEALTVTVTDTGPGIAPEERDRVFDPFYRVVGSGLPGTGLGLAIVKTYANMVGATVTLDDAQPGHTPPGLKVTFHCPLGARKPTEA